MNRRFWLLGSIAGILAEASLSGCASVREPDKHASTMQAGAPVAQSAPQAQRPQSDIQSLQQDRKQDAHVIADAQKALGTLHH